MKYPIPSRVPLPSFRPDMPDPRMNQFPPAPMAPQQQRGGNRLMGVARNNPEVFLSLGAGLLGGRTGPEQWSGGLGAMAQSMGAAREKQESKKEKNRTMEWLRQNAPDYAGAVEQGVLSAGDAYKMTLEAKKPKQFDPTDDIREYQFAQSQGFEGSFQDFMTEMKRAGATNVSVSQGGGKFEEEFAKSDAKTLSDLYSSGLQAQRNITRIDQLDRTLASAPTGAQGALKLAAGQFGIQTEGLDDLQSAQALINSLVPEQRPPGSGPMSDADLELFKQSLPRIINQQGGNKAIIETMRGIAKYDAEGARIVQALRSGQIDRSQAFQMLQSRADPLAGVRGNMTGAPAMPTRQGPTDIDGLVDKWGG